MPLRLAIVDEVMIHQAETLEGISLEQVKNFASFLEKIHFSEESPTKEEKLAFRKVSRALFSCPRTQLEILKTQRDMIKFTIFPAKNASLYILPLYIGEKKSTMDLRQEDKTRPMQIYELFMKEPLLLKLDASFRQLVNRNNVFSLYGRFANYNSRTTQKALNQSTYPIERISDSCENSNVLRVDLPKSGADEYIPAFIFVGNVRPDYCNDALVYVNKRFDSAPEMFYEVMENRAAFFSINGIKNDIHVRAEREGRRLDSKIARLERLLAKQ